jgi:hypothetical protein
MMSLATLIFRMGLIENLIWYVNYIIYANVDRRAISLYTETKETPV